MKLGFEFWPKNATQKIDEIYTFLLLIHGFQRLIRNKNVSVSLISRIQFLG